MRKKYLCADNGLAMVKAAQILQRKKCPKLDRLQENECHNFLTSLDGFKDSTTKTKFDLESNSTKKKLKFYSG